MSMMKSVLLIGLALLLLSGCIMPVDENAPPAVPSAVPSVISPAVTPDGAVPTPVLAQPTLPPGDVAPSAPALLLIEPVGAGQVHLIRHQSAGQDCLSISFDLRVYEATRCGTFVGVGGGFVDFLTDPNGAVHQVAYGWTTPAVTAVAVEFVEGGNANAAARDGGYVLPLAAGQTPQQATGIDQFGNMVGSWGFAP